MIDAWARRLRTESTRENYVHSLTLFLDYYHATPKESVTWTPEEAEDRIRAWQDYLMQEDYAGSTIHTYSNGVRRWFIDHRVRILSTARDIPKTKTYLDYIPNSENAQVVLDALKIHYKVGLALVAFSGLRPSDATGLRYENIKASYENGDKILTIVKRHRKSREWYVSFVGTQGARYIKTLLDQRRARGEQITESSYIVTATGQHLSARALCFAIILAIENTVGRHPTGEPFRRFRTYGFRKRFRRTIDQLGESYAEYMMGHAKGLKSLSITYNGLRDLDPLAIEALKREYMKVLPELETEITDITLRAQLAAKEKQEKRRSEEMAEIREEMAELRDFLKELKEKKED